MAITVCMEYNGDAFRRNNGLFLLTSLVHSYYLDRKNLFGIKISAISLIIVS